MEESCAPDEFSLFPLSWRLAPPDQSLLPRQSPRRPCTLPASTFSRRPLLRYRAFITTRELARPASGAASPFGPAADRASHVTARLIAGRLASCLSDADAAHLQRGQPSALAYR